MTLMTNKKKGIVALKNYYVNELDSLELGERVEECLFWENNPGITPNIWVIWHQQNFLPNGLRWNNT